MTEKECPLCEGTGKVDTVITQDQLAIGWKVVEEVANRYEITVDAMRGRSRTVWLVEAKREAAKIMRSSTKLPLKAIGHLLGGRDHSTVLHLLNSERTASTAPATKSPTERPSTS